MKNTIRQIFFAITIFVLVSAAYAQRREVKPVKFNKISDRLYEITGGRGANGGAYIGDNGVLIIDAKMDKASVDKVFEELKKITDKPVKYLVNTHSDGDHINGNQFFPANITFTAHENCRKEFFHPGRNAQPSIWNKPGLAPFIPSITFNEKMDIYLGSGKVELWYFGIGHTTGDAVVYFPEEKVAFLGDQIFLNRIQLIHSYKGGNSFGHVKALKKMLETLGAEKFCSGHSGIIGRMEIKIHISQMVQRQYSVKELYLKGKSLDEIKSEFSEDEARLITSIYNEIKNNR